MTFDYENTGDIAVERLESVHNASKAKIRANFLEKEYEFFRNHIRNQRVLVAGSGLGHDSFELSKYNKEVVGIELHKRLVGFATKKAKKLGIKNVKFQQGDFTNMQYSKKNFDSVVLNMGTIAGFDDKAKVIKELLRVSNVVYLDFYPPSKEGFSKRKEMYEEEGWTNVRIYGETIVSDDDLESESISKEEMKKIVESIGAKVKYYPLYEFAVMAEIRRSK